jgi:predicted CoA-binding protein
MRIIGRPEGWKNGSLGINLSFFHSSSFQSSNLRRIYSAMAKIIETAAERLDILTRYRRIAMVGLSGNQYRPSHFAAIYMLAEGYEVTPINPSEPEILGRQSYPSLTALAEDNPAAIELVDIFRAPADVPPIVEEAIAVGAKVVWMQLGVVHEEAARRAVAAGLDVVMDRCVKIEHARFFGGLNLIGLNTGVLTSRLHKI